MYNLIEGVSFAAPGKHLKRVNIPVFAEAETLAYLDAVPTLKASLSRTPDSANLTPYLRYRALNDFVKSLKTNGIFAKLDYLGLPIFGQEEGGVSLNNPSFNCDLPTDATIATYSSKGVKFLKGWTFPMNMRLSSNATLAQTIGFYNTLPKPTADVVSVGIGQSASQIWLGRRISVNLSGLLVNGTLNRAVVPNRTQGVGLMLGIFTPTYTATLVDNEYASVTQAYSGTGDPNAKLKLGGHTADSNTAILDAPLGAIVFAQTLSETESKILSASMDTLLAAFAVI